MASSKKRSRSPTPDEDEEESPPNKKIDLKKEPETEADDPNEEADQEEEEELEVEHQGDNANQEEEEVNSDDEVVRAAFALSHIMFQRNLAEAEQNQPEIATNQDDDLNSEIGSSDEVEVEAEPEEETELDNIVASACAIRVPDFDEDDSEQTLGLLRRWKIPAIPPENIVTTGLIEQCSEPIRKQLTEKDVIGRGEQSMRLALPKSQVVKKFFPLLEESEIPIGKEGIRVSVYGPDGKIHEMKMWADDAKKTTVLTTGWREFVGDYELKENCDFVTIWMFRHKESRQICFAIDSTRLSIKKQVSKRISKAAFEDSD